MGIVAQALTHWAPSYMHRAFHWSPAQYGLALGIVFPVAAVLGHLVCGALVDRMTARGRADAPMIFFARAIAVCAPVVCAGFIYPHPVVFLASLFLAKAVMTPYLGYGMAGLMSACPQPFRARTAALFMLVLTLLAGGVGPMLIGALTDFVFRDEAKLGWSVASAVAGCSIVAIFALAWGRPALRAAAVEARELEAARPA
jgi:sugar phosphate permease